MATLVWDSGSYELTASNGFSIPVSLVYTNTSSGGTIRAQLSYNFTGSLIDEQTLIKDINLNCSGTGTDPILFDVSASDITWGNNSRVYLFARTRSSGSGNVGLSTSAILDISAPPVVNAISIESSYTNPKIFIEGVTDIEISFDAIPQAGFSVSSVSATVNGNAVTLSSLNNTHTGTYNSSNVVRGVATIVLTATNNAGQATTYTKEVEVKEVSPPTINAVVFRCSSNGNPNLDGGYLSITAWATPNPSELVISSFSVLVKDSSQTTIYNQSVTNGTTVIIGNGNIVPSTAYTATFSATDDINQNSTLAASVPVVNRVINVKDQGTGIAFGKKAAESNLTDSKWSVRTRDEIQLQPSTGNTRVRHMTPAGNTYGNMYYNTTDRRFQFSEWSFDSGATEPNANYEVYALPTPNEGRTINDTYEILTTKTHEIVSVFRKTVASGATTTLTFSGASSGFMMTANSQAGGRGAYVLFASSTTVYAPTALGSNSGVTFSINGRVITVTNGTSASLGISVIVFSGSIT